MYSFSKAGIQDIFEPQNFFMENILLAVDGARLDMNTVDFACYIARLTNSRLNAIFIENIQGEDTPSLKQEYGAYYVETITSANLPENKKKLADYETNEKIFDQACINRGVNYRVHSNRNAMAKDLIAESRFADLIILNAGTSFEHGDETVPTRFAREVLAGTECPVIIAPYSFSGIDEILFTYDGSRSSVFAIKQFAHLFPQLQNKKITVLQIDKKEIHPFAESNKIEEWLKSHYENIAYKHLHGHAGDELFGYLLKKQNVFVVMGAYGRGMLSSLLRHSTADLLVKTVNLPVFIAHQ